MELKCGPLDDYEEGVFKSYIFTHKKWWQFWKPKKINGDIGTYTRIGKIITVTINGGFSFTGIRTPNKLP